jgi:transcription elongation factor Elf1
MTAFERAWDLVKAEPFFHCPNCNLKDEYHNSSDGSIFCRGCGEYFVLDLDGNWREHDRKTDMGDLL